MCSRWLRNAGNRIWQQNRCRIPVELVQGSCRLCPHLRSHLPRTKRVPIWLCSPCAPAETCPSSVCLERLVPGAGGAGDVLSPAKAPDASWESDFIPWNRCRWWVGWVLINPDLQVSVTRTKLVRFYCLCCCEAEGTAPACLVTGFLIKCLFCSSFRGLCRLFVYLLQLLFSLLNLLSLVSWTQFIAHRRILLFFGCLLLLSWIALITFFSLNISREPPTCLDPPVRRLWCRQNPQTLFAWAEVCPILVKNEQVWQSPRKLKREALCLVPLNLVSRLRAAFGFLCCKSANGKNPSGFH